MCARVARLGVGMGLFLGLSLPGTIDAQMGGRTPLTPGIPHRDSLGGSSPHRWPFELPVGRYAVVEVRQEDTDVLLRILGPDGTVRRMIDAATGAVDTKSARWISDAAGIWILEIELTEGASAGGYEIEWIVDRPAEDDDARRIALGDSAAALGTRGLEAYGERTRDGLRSAISLWDQQAVILADLGERLGEASARNDIGAVHRALGQPDSALAHLREALRIWQEIDHVGGEAVTMSIIGLTFGDIGQPDSALSYMHRALPLRRRAGDREGEGTTLNNIAIVYARVGQADSALAYLGRTLPIRREVGDRPGEASTLNNLGIVYNDLGRPDSALAYLHEALVVRRELGDPRAIGSTLGSIGGVYRGLGQLDSALVYLRLALPIEREAGDQVGVSTALHNIGTVHAGLDRPDSALVYLRQALPLRRETRDRWGEAATLNSIGLAHDALGRPDSAVAYFRSVLSLVRESGDRSVERTTLANIAALYRLSQRPPDMATAVAYYDSAATVQALLAGATGTDANRLSFSEQAVALFEGWTLAWLGSETDRSTASLSSLAAAERGRAQALLDLMRGTRAISPGADLAREARELIQPLVETRTPGLVYYSTLDTLLIWYVDPVGSVEVFRRPVARDTLAAWVAALRTEFGVDDARALEVIAGRGGPPLEIARQPEPLPAEPDLASSLNVRRLAEALLPRDVLSRIPEGANLAVFPHGALNLIPFGALPLPDRDEPLGIAFGLRYAPSLALLRETKRTVSRQLGRTLVVGNPAMPPVRAVEGTVDLIPLPGAEEEGRWVAGELGADFLTGEAATEGDVRRRLPEMDVVHLATHGFAYSTGGRARDSWVVLAPDDEHDGVLTVGEILDDVSDLHARLVVLSACQTGLGDVKRAEGTVGFQRAFLARGAQNVLVSLWNVSDEATNLLMRSFYRHWRTDADGPDMAEALRRAQTDVRSEPGFAHPKFWAAFQLVGSN